MRGDHQANGLTLLCSWALAVPPVAGMLYHLSCSLTDPAVRRVYPGVPCEYQTGCDGRVKDIAWISNSLPLRLPFHRPQTPRVPVFRSPATSLLRYGKAP